MSGAPWALLQDLPAQGRTLISAKGPDVVRFLQGLLSQDVDKMPEGSARAATLLTVKGKICWDAVVLRHAEDHFDLAVPLELADEAYAKLEKHIIMDEVELQRAGPDVQLAVFQGVSPRSEDLQLNYFAGDYPLEGSLVRGPVASLETLGEADARMEQERYARARVGAGIPAWGFEVLADRFPPEVGLVRAVSYDKGCFMGQEPLARIHARGQTNWVLVRVTCDIDLGPCEPGSALALHHAERDEAGRCTTWVRGPAAKAHIGLAIVRRTLAKQGTELTDDRGRLFRVASGPLGDDAGNASNQARRATVSLGSR